MAVLNQIAALPSDWHGQGTLSARVLAAIVRHCSGIAHSVETGCGKSTLLFSHLSADHLVFTLGAGDSLAKTRASPLLRRDTVRIIEGASQTTLPRNPIPRQIEAVLIDGAHEYPLPDLDFFYLSPTLVTGGVLIVDDVQIPTINNLYRFLRADDEFAFVDLVDTTAFFRRTAVRHHVDGDIWERWWLQPYNRRRCLVDWHPRSLARWLLHR